jgi:hypothetical protein
MDRVEGNRGGEPAKLGGSYDLTKFAEHILKNLERLEPQHIPDMPMPSGALLAQFESWPPQSVKEDLKFELDTYVQARDARVAAKSNNKFNLRSLLWAESYLRKNGREEHEVIRAFCMEVWGVIEPASDCYSEREHQVMAHA